jgi:hypothetical protein
MPYQSLRLRRRLPLAGDPAGRDRIQWILSDCVWEAVVAGSIGALRDVALMCRALLIPRAGSPASEQSAHHAANQCSWTASAAVMAPAAAAGRTVVIGFVATAKAGTLC